MNRTKQISLASSLSILLSACGAGTGLPEPEDIANQITEVIEQVEENLGNNQEGSSDSGEQENTQTNVNDTPSNGGGIIVSPDEPSDDNDGRQDSTEDTAAGNDSASNSENDSGNRDENKSEADNDSENSSSNDGQANSDQSDEGQSGDNASGPEESTGSEDPAESSNTDEQGPENTDSSDAHSYEAWDANKVYYEGDRVVYEDVVYQSGWWNQGVNPAQAGEWGVWQPVEDLSDKQTETATDDDQADSELESGEVPEQGENTEEENPVSNAQEETLPAFDTGMYGEYNKLYQQDSGKAIVSYFVEWSVYGRDYHIGDIPAANLTHLLYGFLAICGDNPEAGAGAQQAIASECANKQDFEVTLIDKFAALEKTYPGDTWSDDVYGDHYNGNFGQMKKLKAAYPNLVILPSVGGWTLSTPFFEMANNDQKRAVFVESVVAFINKYDFFDGVDIDWEYPGVNGADAGLASASDAAAYTALMRDLRSAFDELSSETGRDYQITSAIGAGPQHIAAVDYASAHPFMDYIFMMTYDYAGAWSNITGHHSPLYSNREVNDGYYAQAAVEAMLQQGVPSQKLVVGAAMYGRGWNGVSNSNDYAPDLFPLFGEGSGAGRGTWEAGVYDYKDLFNNYIGSENQGINGFNVYYDEVAEAPYLWNESTGEFITYDSPRSVRAKAEFINRHDLGGFLSWEIDGDNGLILNAMNEGLGNTEIPVLN